MSTDTTAINAAMPSNRLADDLRRIVGDAEQLLDEIADATTGELSTTRERFASKLNEARIRVDEARVALGRQAVRAAGATSQYLRDNPWKMLGLVALAGLAGAVLLKRGSRA